ncbi:MAG: hypothetical protein RLZZ214_3466 [Verrucomicrobiota bacterium]
MSAASADVFGDFTYSENQATSPVSVTITDYPTSATGAVEIPAEIAGMPVLAIGPQAFALCAGISSVTIPASVTSIGAQAFLNCTGLAAVDIPSSVTSIENGAFNLCIALTSVTVPVGVTVLADSIFESCSGLTSVTILGNVTSVGNSAFVGCGGLASLAIPGTVTSIGTSAFRFCNGLTSMEIPSGVTALPFGLFSDCENLTSVTLPANLTTIGGSAFAKCVSLTSISTPGAATNPPSIALPATVTSLGTFVFAECGALTSVVIPFGVPSIGTSAFELCTSLTTIAIPSSVMAFGNDAFRSCNSLLSLEIASNATTTIGTNVFEGCTAMTSIMVNPANPSFSSEGGVLFNKPKTTLVTYPRGLAGPYVVPSTVTAIAANAFRFAVGVTSISLPATCTASGLESFAGCSSLTSFTVAPGGTSGFKSGTGPLYSFSGLSLVAYPGGLSGAFTVPSPVSTISESAFRYCGGLTSVTLPGSIVTVRNTAFANCGQLTSATFLGNSPTTLFGTNVFQSAATGFSVFFYATGTGFTAPIWKGYPASAIGPNAALTNWLLGYNLPLNSDLTSDANGDGVSLLMAYALNLDPGQYLGGSSPQPVMTAEEMSMSFYAGAGGVTYVVETSPDLVSWGTEGVSYSDLNQVRTATVSRTPSSRFMRLSASY